MNKEYYKLGQKIRNFRKRAEKSQMDLEIEIGASAGSISRIENGEVNPTKETLYRIINALGLVSYEAVSLLGIDISDSIAEILKFTKDLNNADNIEDIVQKAVDSIVFQLNLLGTFVVLIDKDNNLVRLSTFARSFYSEMAMKVIGKPMFEVSAPIEQASKNYMVRTILDKKNYYSVKIEDFIVPAVSPFISSVLNKITKFKSAMSIPLIHNNETIGAIHFSKSYVDDFQNELPVLEAFADYLTSILYKKIRDDK